MIKQREGKMNKKNIIPLKIPSIGDNNILQFNPNEGIDQICPECNCKTFEKNYYLKRIPKLAKSNRMGKDINLEIITYFCTDCGTELKIDNNISFPQRR